MSNKKTVLIIDDVDQSITINALKRQLKTKCNLEAIAVLTTDVELRKENSDHLDATKLEKKIAEAMETKHIDWALTDFNLAEEDIDGLTVVEMLSKLRKNLKIIMYSGNRTAVVKRVLGKAKIHDASEEEIVDAIRKLLEYHIIEYIKRDDYKDKLIEFINRDDDPTVQDYFLEQLRTHSEMEFKSCYAPLKGKTFGEIADMIENGQDKRTDSWTRELIEQTIAYLVKINE